MNESTSTTAGGLIRLAFNKIGRVIGLNVAQAWAASNGRRYAATTNRYGQFAGYRRVDKDGAIVRRVRCSKKARLAARRLAESAS